MSLVWYFLSRTDYILNIDSTIAENLLKNAQGKASQTRNRHHWPFIGRSTFYLNAGGDLRLSHEDGDDGSRSLPLADLDGKIYPWPTEILGPVNEPTDLYALPGSTSSTTSIPGLCGIPCSSAADCPYNALDPAASCHCIPATQSIQEMFNLDAVFPVLGLCLTSVGMVAVAQSIADRVNGLEGISDPLRGRDLVENKLSENGQLQCLCNATFVAEACCHTRTGLL